MFLVKIKLEAKVKQLEETIDQMQLQIQSLQQPVCGNTKIVPQDELTASLFDGNQQYCSQLM